MRRLASLLLACIWILSAAFSAAQEAAQRGPAAMQGAAILKLVDDHYNNLRSLRARFVEHYTGMGMDRSESGQLLLAKPGRMRWSYDAPVGKVFVLDGKYAWSYTPGDAEAQRSSAKKLDDLRSPLRLLLGHTQLAKELSGASVARTGANYLIAGAPSGLENRVKAVKLEVTPAGAIVDMRIEELDGAATEFNFSQMQENVPVSAADFTFTVPPGVSVVEGLPPV